MNLVIFDITIMAMVYLTYRVVTLLNKVVAGVDGGGVASWVVRVLMIIMVIIMILTRERTFEKSLPGCTKHSSSHCSGKPSQNWGNRRRSRQHRVLFGQHSLIWIIMMISHRLHIHRPCSNWHRPYIRPTWPRHEFVECVCCSMDFYGMDFLAWIF